MSFPWCWNAPQAMKNGTSSTAAENMVTIHRLSGGQHTSVRHRSGLSAYLAPAIHASAGIVFPMARRGLSLMRCSR
jgi:hypothetical protein